MATKKRSGARKSKAKKDAPAKLVPAVPPPDDPLERFTEFDANREYNSEEMAEKRLEAIRHTREMPSSETEESPTTEEETSTTQPEQDTSTTESDSTNED